MNVADLFPETLLVENIGGRAFTTSLKEAEHFKKPHNDVLKKIQRVIEQSAQEDSLGNFSQSDYKTARSKTYPMYRLTEEGFAILAMSFTGEEAMRWKWAFLRAFRDMERQLASRDRRYVRALAQVRPSLIPVVEMTKKGLCRAAIAAPLGKSLASITYHRRAARALGLLGGRSA